MRALAVLAFVLFTAPAQGQQHTGQDDRLHTNRPTGRQLIELPKEQDAFGFVIFGDRTTGRPEGLKVLDQAVTDTNLLDPDLVMTVGDLVQGYNATEEWLQQAREYKDIVGKLRMPWFPVAGNHDVYWRGPGKPAGEHEQNYETHFGPLWYAFVHKKCWFVVLYSDEGNPVTGKKDFSDPDCQRISPEQFAWLKETLQKAAGAPHVFVFLHHPRWLTERYGDDWAKVHGALAAAGNVTAVFAGHIHRMRFDGVRDGVQYFTLAATGGNLDLEVPQAGYLHEFHVVTVRPGGIQVATLPVGAVMDPKLITGEVSDDAAILDRHLRPAEVRGVAIAADGSADGVLQMDFHNRARRPIEVTLEPGGKGWSFRPDHTHLVIPPGGSTTVAFTAGRQPSEPDFVLPDLRLNCDYLGDGVRFALPERRHELPLAPPVDLGRGASPQPGTLRLDGKKDCLELPAVALALPDGPFTVEAWFRSDDYAGRRALLAKTESSEWGIFVSDGELEFSVHLDGRYRTAKSDGKVLQTGKWHHVAGVFDGQEVRVYLDGKVIDRKKGSGKRTPNGHPVFVGADPDGNGNPNSFFTGAVDDVRISRVVRYQGAEFAPGRHPEADADTVWLLHLDQHFGPWTPDGSVNRAHPRRRGGAACVPDGR